MAFVISLTVFLVLVVAAIPVGFSFYQKYKAQYKLNAATVFGVFFGLVGALLITHAMLFWPNEKVRIYAELTALAGAALGWLAGMWLSPIGSNESVKFAKYWTAIGVGSGFTLKWLMEKFGDGPYRDWIVQHPFLCLIFSFSLLLTTAAVYSTRAYNDCLLIAPRKPLDAGVTLKDDYVEVTVNSSAHFYAAVVGANDPASHWQVLPATLGAVTADGTFTAAAAPAQGRITAFNMEDPTLSNSIDVHVV